MTVTTAGETWAIASRIRSPSEGGRVAEVRTETGVVVGSLSRLSAIAPPARPPATPATTATPSTAKRRGQGIMAMVETLRDRTVKEGQRGKSV